ncbi:hypothetical protein DXG01_009722 [Tephrocybe rancida]|nr:hypothetical protein DXG01_009722 [Tephrocybe rancida]
MSSAANATGLTPSESKALKERPIQPHEQRIVHAIKEVGRSVISHISTLFSLRLQMYSCSPKEDTFKIYAGNAIFHDPVGIAKGPDSIRAQFLGLAKIFPRADIPKFRLLENPSNLPKNTILIDQDVSYFRNAKASSPTKTLNSLLTIKVNDAYLVTSHEEHWNHEKNSTSDDGFLGMINEQRKKLTASFTDTVVGKPKD